MKEMTTSKRIWLGVFVVVVAAAVAFCWKSFRLDRLEEGSIVFMDIMKIMKSFSLNFSSFLALFVLIVSALAVIVCVEYFRKDREVQGLKKTEATLRAETEEKQSNVLMLEDKAAKETSALQKELEECRLENSRLVEQLQSYEEELEKSRGFENNIVAQLAYCEKFFQTIQALHPEFDFQKEMEEVKEKECRQKAAEIELAYEEAKAKKMSLSYAYQLYQLLDEDSVVYVSTLVAAELQKFAMEREGQKKTATA